MTKNEKVSRYVIATALCLVVLLCIYLVSRGVLVPNADLFTALGTILTAAGLGYAALQLRTSQIIAQSEFVLRIYEMMQEHNDIHLALTYGGKWAGDRGPESEEEWMDVSRYMGLFEPIQLLLSGNLLNIKMVDVLYSHRVLAVVRNPVIFREHLVNRAYRWREFGDLWMSLRSQETFQAIAQNEGHGDIESTHEAEFRRMQRS